MNFAGRFSLLCFSLCISTLLFFSTSVRAETNILLIVDGSNSMWGQIENKAKVETARKTLSKLISDLPAEANLGLMAYGHTREKDCNDVELLSALGKDKPEMITTLIHTIQPKGKTPIANALAQSKDAFKGREGQNNHVLLVSDGIESCDGDPCAVAKSLQEAGLDVSAHVIGFGVSKEEGKQLTCIAENTGGKYFDVADTAAFNEAIKEVTEIAVAEPEPEPEPEPELWFEDNFDGEMLGDDWEVKNPDPNNYIVEDGVLMALHSKQIGLNNPDLPNVFQLSKGLPKGNWVATIKFDVDFQSAQERIFFGLYEDELNYLVNVMSTAQGSCYSGGSYHTHLYLTASKATDGAVTNNKQEVWKVARCDGGSYNELMAKGQPFLLRMTKKGRAYTAAIKMEGDEEPKWVELPSLKALRAKGNLAIGMYQDQSGNGETTLSVDWIKIESVEK